MQENINIKPKILITHNDVSRCFSGLGISPNSFKKRADQLKIQLLIDLERIITNKPVANRMRNNNIKPICTNDIVYPYFIKP